jgi:hypothetical protein
MRIHCTGLTQCHIWGGTERKRKGEKKRKKNNQFSATFGAELKEILKSQ